MELNDYSSRFLELVVQPDIVPLAGLLCYSKHSRSTTRISLGVKPIESHSYGQRTHTTQRSVVSVHAVFGVRSLCQLSDRDP